MPFSAAIMFDEAHRRIVRYVLIAVQDRIYQINPKIALKSEEDGLPLERAACAGE